MKIDELIMFNMYLHCIICSCNHWNRMYLVQSQTKVLHHFQLQHELSDYGDSFMFNTRIALKHLACAISCFGALFALTSSVSDSC